MFDTILRGGRVFDGSGTKPYKSDVAISDDRIAQIGSLDAAQAHEVIDISGLCVSPGFIDVHAHTDLVAYLPDDQKKVKVAGLLQGVTTEVAGNCGASPFPLRADPNEDPYLGTFSAGQGIGFRRLADYREAMSEKALAANVAPLLGHGTVRAVVMGRDDRAPTPDELKQMRRLTAEAMEDGAFGLSTGLIYSPGLFSETEEIVELAKELAPFGRPYTTHMRDEGDHVEEALAEALRIGRESRVSVQVSHHKVSGRRNWGNSARTLEQIEDARASGTDVTIDAYPYTAGSTFLAAVLPPWVLDGGPTAIAERLRDPAALDRIKQDTLTGLPRWQNLAEGAGWDSIVVAGAPPNAGRSIGELAAAAGRHPVDLVAQLLLEDPATMMIVHMMEQGEVDTIINQPFAMVGSDGIPLPGLQHPRLAGAFARVLGRHRDDDVALAGAIRRMTQLPADRFHLGGRGSIAKGQIADLVVFDQVAVSDSATYEDPLLPPTGIARVFLSGREVVSGAAFRDLWRGEVLEPA